MPSNPYKDQQRCFAYLKKILVKADGLDREMLVCELLASYPVSEQAVDRFISAHVRRGIVEDRGGVLYAFKA